VFIQSLVEVPGAQANLTYIYMHQHSHTQCLNCFHIVAYFYTHKTLDSRH